MKSLAICATLLCPTLGMAEGITITNAFVPLAPKGAMAHAAYMQVTNKGDTTRSIIGVSAPNYTMAHLHESPVQDGIARMTSLQQLDIAPGQTVVLEPGGRHVMLMKPSAPHRLGGAVALDVQFANGETLSITAEVVRRDGSS